MSGIARQHLIVSKENLKEYYDRKINSRNFKIGYGAFLLGRELKKFGKTVLRTV